MKLMLMRPEAASSSKYSHRKTAFSLPYLVFHPVQIKLYQNLLEMKHSELNGKVMRLENGLEKLRTTAIQVDDLKEKLAVQVIIKE